MTKHNAYRNGRIHVCDRLCSTCIFRDGNLMHLSEGRVEQMIAEAVSSDSTIICHATLDGDNAACRGFFDQHKTQPLQIAERLGLIEFVTPPKIILKGRKNERATAKRSTIKHPAARKPPKSIRRTKKVRKDASNASGSD